MQPDYSDKYTFFEKGSTIIPVRKRYTAKGWYDLQVGKYTEKTRSPDIHRLLDKHYKGAKRISLFQSLSYHRGSGGKIENYGTKPYTLEYTKRVPIKRYKLVTPVKSNRKSDFGKLIHSVTTYKWIYVVIDWHPMGNKIKLSVERKTKYPDGKEVVHFKSAKYDEKDYKKVIKLFRNHVAKAKRM